MSRLPVSKGSKRPETLVALGVGHLLSPEIVAPHVSPW